MVSNNSEHRATLRQWQLFILTVEKGSILAASAAANTDAAVVSREITKLEPVSYTHLTLPTNSLV